MVGVFVRKWERGGGWALNACMSGIGDCRLEAADWVVVMLWFDTFINIASIALERMRHKPERT